MLFDLVSTVMAPWSHRQSLNDVRPRSCDFILSRNLTRLLIVRKRPRVYSLPVEMKKNRTSWFSTIYWMPQSAVEDLQAAANPLTLLWYIPMATSIETVGNTADSQDIVKMRHNTRSEDRRPVLEFQRNIITGPRWLVFPRMLSLVLTNDSHCDIER